MQVHLFYREKQKVK